MKENYEKMCSNVTSMSDVAPICLEKTFPVGWEGGFGGGWWLGG